jgi:hypothetical protein
MTKLSTCVVVAAVVLASSAAWALPYDPSGRRGDEGTTFEYWQFGTDDDPDAPDDVMNPYGSAVADIEVGVFASGWYDSIPPVYGSRQGFWDIAEGIITLTIPNRDQALPYKEIWVQVVYWQDISAIPEISIPGAEPWGDLFDPVLVEEGPSTGAWYMALSHWRMTPNPDSETIVVIGDPDWGSIVDEIIVDTYCVPEPATITLLVLGSIGAAILRKRH